MTEEEFASQKSGDSFEEAIIITLNTPMHAVVDEPREKRYYVFTATESGSYTFEADHTTATYGDTYCGLYKADDLDWEWDYDDDGGEGYHFKLTANLTAGETYYVVVKCYSTNTGEFDFTVTKD